MLIKPCQFSTVCECCIQSKMTWKPFPKKSESKTDEILDLIHTDVCGPMQTTAPGGKRYFMTMIDDSSRYTEVYLLGQLSEVPEKIKEYVRHVQTKFGKTPKKIRSDRGGKYTAERFIHSFILNIYIAPLQENYSEALPTPARSNKAV